MAFFIRTYPTSPPNHSKGGYLGLVNNPNNSANTDFSPTITVEFGRIWNEWDPNHAMKHVGVDVNNIAAVAYTALPDRCFNGTTISA
ncbi:unnamed protein product [Urochloa humidicola]